jgi:GR25 family glycosyltransferase involved in LPS biosynthesis
MAINIPIYIINLERRPDRKQYMITQMETLGIKNYEFISATDYQTLNSTDVNKIYNSELAKKVQWELALPEIACAMSHRKVYKTIVDDNIDYAIVLEDDVILTEDFKNLVAEFELDCSVNIDVLMLGYHTSNTINIDLNEKNIVNCYKKVLTNTNSVAYFDEECITINNIDFYKFNKQSYTVDYISGAYACLITKKFAKQVLSHKIFVEADCVWNHIKLDIYGAIPTICNFSNSFLSNIAQDRKHTFEKECSKLYLNRSNQLTFGK